MIRVVIIIMIIIINKIMQNSKLLPLKIFFLFFSTFFPEQLFLSWVFGIWRQIEHFIFSPSFLFLDEIFPFSLRSHLPHFASSNQVFYKEWKQNNPFFAFIQTTWPLFLRSVAVHRYINPLIKNVIVIVVIARIYKFMFPLSKSQNRKH